ncbi:hypothetical protein [Streptomyces sp. NPDC051173]|uniref:hypothetical protein n=1 Tax=Streptomyces sp. NPDC051173 TaxID=3155164 RepID=UPI00344B37FE
MRSGPRHAAARKPLLARLHMPAGKAVAIAAMPTAVLMGMGLTPQLASAKPPLPEPFDGQCATAPDASPEPGASGSTSASPAPSRSAKESVTRPSEQPSKAPTSPSAKPEAKPEPGGSPDADKPGKPAKGGPSPAQPPVPQSASPSPSKSFNPLDPLGLGDKLRDILDGGKSGAGKQPSAPPSASPDPSGSPSAPSGAKHAAPPPADARTPGEQPSGKPSTAPSAKPSTAPSSAATGTSPSPGTSASPGALPPCPKGKAADGNDGHFFPNQPWYLEASVLTLKGLTYEGIKKITMVNGQQKSVLKFTADALTIKDLHQIVNSYGKEYHIVGPGTDSTVTGGQVTLYTEELKGNLLGLIPSTASPTSPPPLIPGLKLPIPIFYTNVKIRQGGQFGGTLHIPNLHQYLTDGTYS